MSYIISLKLRQRHWLKEGQLELNLLAFVQLGQAVMSLQSNSE